MKKIYGLLILSISFIGCKSDDSVIPKEQDHGFINMTYNSEKLSFGKNAYNGWLLNESRDTIALFYTARIVLNNDPSDFYDIKLYAYLDDRNGIDRVEMDFLPPFKDRKGWVYQYSLEQKPMIYKNIEFDGKWLKGNFDGYLHYSLTEDKDPVHLTNGQFNIPLKGLRLPSSK